MGFWSIQLQMGGIPCEYPRAGIQGKYLHLKIRKTIWKEFWSCSFRFQLNVLELFWDQFGIQNCAYLRKVQTSWDDFLTLREFIPYWRYVNGNFVFVRRVCKINIFSSCEYETYTVIENVIGDKHVSVFVSVRSVSPVHVHRFRLLLKPPHTSKSRLQRSWE